MMNEVVISAQNTTNEIQTLNLFQADNPADNANAATKYSYDFTGKNLSAVFLGSLGTTDKNGNNLIVQSFNINTPSLQGIADGLTSLGFGSWYVEFETINCNSDDFIFGNMAIFNIP